MQRNKHKDNDMNNGLTNLMVFPCTHSVLYEMQKFIPLQIANNFSQAEKFAGLLYAIKFPLGLSGTEGQKTPKEYLWKSKEISIEGLTTDHVQAVAKILIKCGNPHKNSLANIPQHLSFGLKMHLVLNLFLDWTIEQPTVTVKRLVPWLLHGGNTLRLYLMCDDPPGKCEQTYDIPSGLCGNPECRVYDFHACPTDVSELLPQLSEQPAWRREFSTPLDVDQFELSTANGVPRITVSFK